MYKIYGLTTKKDNIIKYVGLTSKTLEKRLKQHIYSSTKKGKTSYNKKEAWIKNRIESGYKIEIIEIESNLTKEEAFRLEIAWIAYYGIDNLVNNTFGGEGVVGKQYSYEERINWYNAIKVFQYDLLGNLIKDFPTIVEASKQTGIKFSSINYCVNSKYLSTHGYIFVSDKNEIEDRLKKINENNSKYKLYDIYGNLIDTSNCISNLCKKYNFTQRITEFSKRLNNGIVPKNIFSEYFILYPNFNLNVMLTSLNRYKIVNIKTKEIKYFVKIEDISKFLNCSKSLITDCLCKIRLSAKGWTIHYRDDVIEKYSPKNIKKIVELDLNGNMINQFDSILECAKHYNLDSSSITKVCKGIRKHIKKHIFKYMMT